MRRKLVLGKRRKFAVIKGRSYDVRQPSDFVMDAEEYAAVDPDAMDAAVDAFAASLPFVNVPRDYFDRRASAALERASIRSMSLDPRGSVKRKYSGGKLPYEDPTAKVKKVYRVRGVKRYQPRQGGK